MSKWDADAVKALRAAVFKQDGSVVEVLRGRLTDDVLQLAGDGLLRAVAQDVENADELAAQCAAALRERGWSGDEELAGQLQAALDTGATPLLRPLPVDLEELASLLEGGSLCGGGRIDLKTGGCWPDNLEYDEDDADEADEDQDRWLYVEPVGSREAYQDVSCSSPRRKIQQSPTGSRSRSTERVRFVGSKTCSRGGPTSCSATTCCPMSASAAAPAPGSLSKAIDQQHDARVRRMPFAPARRRANAHARVGAAPSRVKPCG